MAILAGDQVRRKKKWPLGERPGATSAMRQCGYRMRKLPGRSKAPAMAVVRIVAGLGKHVPSPGT